MIDLVYADRDCKSPNMALLAATSRTLGGFLGHDPNFAHRFSRSPFYTGESPDRYIWYRQHHRIDRLSDFIREVREVADEPQHVSPRQEFSSGRELIETVKARREPAQAFRAIAKPWPGGCVVMSPRARLTPTAHRPPVMPPQANARPCPPWAAEAAKKPPRGGKQTPKENTPRASGKPARS
ncbi:replication initiation protein [Corynebacterium propinquum]|uniref:replication initiation protein n=1 Tax=Corynebacterium propinquum TaxID=43769 RepID=UPI002540C186|nr:replication initiation protein [Corynebacterium propinquum]MDK4235933.1 replication initiation protein [Corynebacterium propinquum]WKS31191.1 replication initiation protein [Corynebacterium propinquum]WKS37481.1 replication initiation protein [Corynebacterium propinquum]WKS39572.1 replication initiation protein [Corynebacterium propinquum]WKS43780.1 replication initiation protein [Corynebacterium propinquum]